MKDFQIIWRGIVHDSQGYAQASREYILGLDKIGVDVKVEPINFGTPPVQLSTEKTKRLRELIAKPLAEDKIKVLVYHAQPYGVDPNAEKTKGYDFVICNTVWETDRIPESWFPYVNLFDAIFVPSTENIISLRNSGVDVPIFLVPHGADTVYYNPDNKPLELGPAKDAFTFLSVFKWEHRKAPEILLDAYWQEFSNKDNVALVIKSYWGDGRKKSDQRIVRDRINHYKNIKGHSDGTAPVYYSGSLLSDDDMKGLYTLANAFVLPTRGEGVGLPYIESLSSGTPVIATNWGGQTDFVNEDNGFLVDYELESPSKSFEVSIAPHFNQIFTDNMKWAKPSTNSLRKRMREAYENQEATRLKGLQGRKDMETMTWSKSAQDLIKHLEFII